MNEYFMAQNTKKIPINPFFEILKSSQEGKTIQESQKPHLRYSDQTHNQSNVQNQRMSNQQQINTMLPRTCSLTIVHNTSFIQSNKNNAILDKPQQSTIVPSIKFTSKQSYNKSYKMESARQMMSPKLEQSKTKIQFYDQISEKSSGSPILSPTLGKGLQWSTKKKTKSKKSDDIQPKKRIGQKSFDIIPVKTNIFINDNVSQVYYNNKGRRRSANQIYKTSNNSMIPSPTSQQQSSPTGRKIKRDYSFTVLTSKPSIKKLLSPSSGSQQNKPLKAKYFQAPTAPDTPSAKNHKIFQKQDFYILKQLGHGRFGQVNLVQNKEIGFICAMKTMKKSTILQQDFVTQLSRQIMIQMYLKHLNIASLYGVFDDSEAVYLLLQPCLDGQLYKYMKKNRPLPLPQPQAVNLIRQICQGVQYLHQQCIIHRDLKPQNIIMHQGLIKICDFGWAVYNKNSIRSTFGGTPLFLSPQMLLGQQYCQKVDNWALGIISYQMLVGRPPFKIKTQKQLQKIITEQIRFPQNCQLSQQAMDFIKKLLNKNQSQRIQIEQALDHEFLNYQDQ